MEKTKECTKCHKIKLISEFGQRTYSNRITIRSDCKKCNSEYAKQRRDNNPEKILESNRKYLAKNVEKAKEWNRKHFKNNGDRVRERARINSKRYYQDEHIKIKCSCRKRIKNALKKLDATKSHNTDTLIGCSIQFLKEWLQFQFYDGIIWENYGSYWHIDHVTPCASFDLTKEEEQLACFSWENLRPYKSTKNMSKGDKILPFEIMLQQLKVKCYKKNNFKI